MASRSAAKPRSGSSGISTASAPANSGPPVYTGYPGSAARATLSGSRKARFRLKTHSLAPSTGMISDSGSRATPKRRSKKRAKASRSSGRPRFDGYWWVPGSLAAVARASITGWGVGVSGSPIPRLITSTPAARFSLIFRSSSANRYGGRRSSRLLGCIQLLEEFLAQRPRVHGTRPAGQVHMEVLAHVDHELAPVEHHGHRAVHTTQGGRHGRARGAGAGRHRLADPALEDPRADLRVARAAPEGYVRAVRESLVALDLGPVALEVQLLE